ncbi:DUF6460 domain-containing protein [Martelella mediterranea]|uniref:DUF6460 domain-containing protein n=1 Tax=Martelella mediterranea TaxID=293089 RepID=A0A4R3NVF6_9HYPH|nr:DUF6460 domain-containing protein [Martelella mediterranea]TCT43090.1 hypothetical protein EDC90_100399 [Martelella mediterranea]
MSNEVNRFLGGTVVGTIVRLLVVSLIVGFILSALNIDPIDLYHGVIDFFVNIWNRGFQALGEIGHYFILGAIIVIPVFLIIRILSYRR